MLIFAEGGKPENPEKNPRGKGENQQQTQFTCDADPEITVVRGELLVATPSMLPIALFYEPIDLWLAFYIMNGYRQRALSYRFSTRISEWV
jgi:hypothetical protein